MQVFRVARGIATVETARTWQAELTRGVDMNPGPIAKRQKLPPDPIGDALADVYSFLLKKIAEREPHEGVSNKDTLPAPVEADRVPASLGQGATAVDLQR
jgi:hypothetical protein